MSEDSLYKLIDELKENGVSAEISELKGGKNGEIQKVLRISVKLDFSEHDKVFEDKIADLEDEITSLKSHMLRLRERCMDGARRFFENGTYGCLTIVSRNGDLEVENQELKQRIAELESKETVDLPFDPLETANYLINATYERETSSLERTFAKTPDKVNSDRYTVDDLEPIAEYLLVYCKHNKESE